MAFEIKASVEAKLTKGFYTAREDIKPTRTFIVSRNNDTWNTPDEVTHTNLQDLPKELAIY